MNRELRLMDAFVNLLDDHRKDYEGFARDIENVRYCHTPVDGQQINRCEYALRNMEMRLLTIHDCIQSGQYEQEALAELVDTKNTWREMKTRVDAYLKAMNKIVDATNDVLRPVRQQMNSV